MEWRLFEDAHKAHDDTRCWFLMCSQRPHISVYKVLLPNFFDARTVLERPLLYTFVLLDATLLLLKTGSADVGVSQLCVGDAVADVDTEAFVVASSVSLIMAPELMKIWHSATDTHGIDEWAYYTVPSVVVIVCKL